MQFDQKQLAAYIASYKADFARIDREEIYKWYLVAQFQKLWDDTVADFAGMLAEAMPQTVRTRYGKESNNLLSEMNFYPRKMLLLFAQEDPDTVREMFRRLFDERQALTERVETFTRQSVVLLKQYGDTSMKQHYQNANAISIYLFLRYPEKYYIYKYSECKSCAEKLGYSRLPKRGDVATVQAAMEFYDEIQKVVAQDAELVELSKRRLQASCYPDESLRILTGDLVHFISQSVPGEWYPSLADYEPGLSEARWTALLQDDAVFTDDALKIMKRILHHGGIASCTQLSEAYGAEKNFYNSGSVNLARRVQQRTDCPLLLRDNGNAKWWPVLYQGKWKQENGKRQYIWKLRPELEAALRKLDLDRIPLYAAKAQDTAAGEASDLLPVYDKDAFLSEVYMDAEQYAMLRGLLLRKKNVILQGAPGVGKTFAARRLAYSILGCVDEAKVKLVQFHQNYAYEDFVLGYRPDGEGFKLQTGVFYQFCQQAEAQPDEKFFFIIDEINRGNLSRIFGELLLLIEREYRGEKLALAYGGESFLVPENLYIIGMMNTADRSLALLDYALRRRFSFFTMSPAFRQAGFVRYRERLQSGALEAVLEVVERLNREIEEDPALGAGFCIGHSYFCGQETCDEAWLAEVIAYDLIPMLQEYWFDEKEKARMWAKQLQEALYA